MKKTEGELMMDKVNIHKNDYIVIREFCSDKTIESMVAKIIIAKNKKRQILAS